MCDFTTLTEGIQICQDMAYHLANQMKSREMTDHLKAMVSTMSESGLLAALLYYIVFISLLHHKIKTPAVLSIIFCCLSIDFVGIYLRQAPELYLLAASLFWMAIAAYQYTLRNLQTMSSVLIMIAFNAITAWSYAYAPTPTAIESNYSYILTAIHLCIICSLGGYRNIKIARVYFSYWFNVLRYSVRDTLARAFARCYYCTSGNPAAV